MIVLRSHFAPFLRRSRTAWGKQGDAAHIFEMRLVSMPADARAFAVFVDQHLLERGCRPICEDGHLVPERHEEVRDRRRLDHGAAVIVVAQAEADHTAVREMTVKVERLERQVLQLADEF